MKKITLSIFALFLGLSLATASTAEAAPASLSMLYGPDLQVGSQGVFVTELQAFLGEQGYFILPVGVKFGYFGSITRSALMRWQTAAGIPATGYFGVQSKTAVQSYLASHCWLGTCN